MTDSQQLLADYRQNGSDAAFRELVTRYVDLVYSTALRLVEGDTHRAEDVAQTVFMDLARKARTLPREVRLGGWLHRDTCLVAGHTMRGERRRQSRERQAVEMNVLQNHSGADFSQVAPLLDEAINELGEAERTAILLRFFEQQDFRAVGQALGSSEDAARMRVTRALDKLHTLLTHRGVTLSAAALGTALATEAVTAAPAGLAGSVAATALASAAAGTVTTLSILKSMSLAKLTLGVAGVVIAGVLATSLFREHQAQSRLHDENQALQHQISQLDQLAVENARLSNQLVEAKSGREQFPEEQFRELLRLRGEVGVLRLKPSAALRGVLVTPDGAPVAGGTVAISTGQSVGMPDLKNTRLVDMRGQSKVVTTDAAGEFVLLSPPETGTVLAADKKGFGSASVQQVRDSGRLVLQGYGRIEGTYTRGGRPVAGQKFTLSMSDPAISFDLRQYKATTDENGRFTFDQVPPGAGQVVHLVSTSPNVWTPSYGADVTVLPGQAAQVTLGDSGATLTGRIRFESPPAEAEKLSLQGSLRTALPPLPGLMRVEEARAYERTPEGKERSKQMKVFAVNIADDGSWNADSIPPGTYTLGVTASKAGSRPWENPPVATCNVQVVVPEGATPQTQISVDEVVLRPNSR